MIKEYSFNEQEKSSGQLKITIDKKDLESSYNTLLQKYAGSLEIKGFRKGKIPKSVVESKFKAPILSETLEKITQESLEEVIEKLEDAQKPLGYEAPKLEGEPEIKLGEDLEISVVYDVFPRFELGSYSGIELTEAKVTLSQEEVDAEIEKIREQYASVENKEGGVVADTDAVTFDSVELDDKGEAIEGTLKEGVVLTVGSGHNYYKLDDDILGMKLGEVKVIEKKYDDKELNEELKSTTKKIQVTVKELKIKKLPAIDDELAKDVNEEYQTLEQLKDVISKNLEIQVEDKTYRNKTKQVLDSLREKHEISVPESMIRSEIFMRMQGTLQQYGINPEDFFKNISKNPGGLESFFEEGRPEAEESLKSALLLSEISKKENIEVSDEEVDTYLKDVVKLEDDKVEEFKQNQDMDKLKKQVEEHKLFSAIFKQSKIKTKKMSYAELMAL